MELYAVTLKFPLLLPTPGWAATWMACGCATLVVIMFRTLFDAAPGWGVANSVSEASVRKGILMVAFVVIAWPLYAGLLAFMIWFEKTGRADELERKREAAMNADI